MVLEVAEMTDRDEISTLFLDIGGVLATNGWDHNSRRAAAEKFGFDYDEMDLRHDYVFDLYEEGKITLERYLDCVVFWKEREFTQEEFQEYIYAQSKPDVESIEFFSELSERHGLQVGAISDEGRELSEFRIEEFGLKEFMDFFICSAFVGLRKPDTDIYRMALDIAQVQPQHAVYVDDRPLLVEVASGMGIHAIEFTTLDQAKQKLAEMGLD